MKPPAASIAGRVGSSKRFTRLVWPSTCLATYSSKAANTCALSTSTSNIVGRLPMAAEAKRPLSLFRILLALAMLVASCILALERLSNHLLGLQQKTGRLVSHHWAPLIPLVNRYLRLRD